MSKKYTFITLFSLIVIAIVAGIFAAPALPDQMATHWNASGQSDGTMPKFWALAFVPIVLAVMLFFYWLVPKIDPLGKNTDAFGPPYNMFFVALFLFFLYIFALMLCWNLGRQFDFTRAIVPAFAVLLFCIGTLLEKTKRNWFVGIRTPWTLSSDAVWDKTHRVGARLFKASAILVLIAIFFLNGLLLFWVVVGSAVLIALFSVVYSFYLYKKYQ